MVIPYATLEPELKYKCIFAEEKLLLCPISSSRFASKQVRSVGIRAKMPVSWQLELTFHPISITHKSKGVTLALATALLTGY